MKLYYIANLKSSKTTEICVTDLVNRTPRPDFPSKKEYLNWASCDDTDHVFFSAIEGLNPHVRVSKSNDAIKLHGIVADYDAEMDIDEAIAGIKKRWAIDYKPSYISSTFSGGIRLIWVFEEPISFFTKTLFKKFIAYFKKVAKIDKLLPGLDKCISEESQYYELGTNWKAFEAVQPVEANLLHHIQYEVSASTSGFSDGHPSLPIEAIQTGMDETYPGMWTNFSFGSRGPCFWMLDGRDAKSVPNSAVLHPQGIQFFADGGGFLPWSDERMLGSSFVRRHQANRIGGSVAGLYFDGKSYYRKKDGTEHNEWLDDGTEVIKRFLEVNFNLSSRSINGIPSEVKCALTHIETHNRVNGLMPTLYSDQPIVRRDGKIYLNTNTCFAHAMAEEPQKWGENFPFIAAWLLCILHKSTPQQKDYLFAWMHHAFRSAKLGKPIKLPCLFLVGGTGIGKTLFSTFLMSKLLGGHSVASGYFMGTEPFNENIITTGLATIDDQENTTSQQQRNKFAAILKKVIANHSISYRKMYKGPMELLWLGKIIVTCNTDAESMATLPNMDMSNVDKVLILKCADELENFTFPANVEDVIEKELQYFARWLYDYVPNKEVIGASRFTVKAFIEPSLMEEARSMSEYAPIEEIIDKWRREYFLYETKEDFWHGSLIELMHNIEQLFTGDGGGKKVLEGVNNRSLGNAIKRLESQGADWIDRNVTVKGRKGFRLWKITD